MNQAWNVKAEVRTTPAIVDTPKINPSEHHRGGEPSHRTDPPCWRIV